MMKLDDSFQQRWEFRNGKDTSSDDEGSDPSNNATTDLVLYKNDDPAIKMEKKTTKTKTKKSSKKKMRKDSINEKAVFRDLKIFADSLIHELAAARKSMFAEMRDEMGKLVASIPKKGLVKKNTAAAQPNELQKNNTNPFQYDQLRGPTNVSSSQLQNQRNSIHLINNHIPFPSMDGNSGRLVGAKSFGGFALNYHKSWGFYGESRSHISQGVGFPVDRGTDECFNRPSMAFVGGMGLRSSGASLGGLIPNGIASSLVRKTDGEFARSQVQKDMIRFNAANTS